MGAWPRVVEADVVNSCQFLRISYKENRMGSTRERSDTKAFVQETGKTESSLPSRGDGKEDSVCSFLLGF